MFDTHCHLNFQAFDGRVEEIVNEARQKGITYIVVPGTDVKSSKKAVEVASHFPHVFAAVGIHPHHVFEHQQRDDEESLRSEFSQIETLLSNPSVVAVGEVGMDRHYYKNTKYEKYQIDEKFISLQKEVLRKQIELAVKYSKSLILHNREAKEDFLQVVDNTWDEKLEGRTVFHCCEPDEELLEYAQKHNIFIGVDGDVTYSQEKQGFVKKIPLKNLVLETDSPFLTPEPYRSLPRDKKPMNSPAYLPEIASFIAKIKGISMDNLSKITKANACILFQVES